MKIKLNKAVSNQVAVIYRISMRLETVDAAVVALASLTHQQLIIMCGGAAPSTQTMQWIEMTQAKKLGPLVTKLGRK